MLVCNPISGSRRGLAYLSRVRRALEVAEIPYTHAITKGRGDAARLAHSAVLQGCGAVVAIGGDGTFFEVVNGVIGLGVGAGVEKEPVAVGLVQAGRGSDFGRSAGIPSDVEAACARLVEGRIRLIDLGRVTYRAFDGKERTRYFANAAGMGFDAEVSIRANAGSRLMGSTLPYLSSLLATLWTYHNKRVTVRLDDRQAWQARINSIVVANGQYFGGGMKIAPEAQLADGCLDIVALGDLGKIDLMRNVPKVYDGSHLSHPKVKSSRGREVKVTSPERILLQADGEVLGTAPALFSVIPHALHLIA